MKITELLNENDTKDKQDDSYTKLEKYLKNYDNIDSRKEQAKIIDAAKKYIKDDENDRKKRASLKQLLDKIMTPTKSTDGESDFRMRSGENKADYYKRLANKKLTRSR